jgi:hypothetical protein
MVLQSRNRLAAFMWHFSYGSPWDVSLVCRGGCCGRAKQLKTKARKKDPGQRPSSGARAAIYEGILLAANKSRFAAFVSQSCFSLPSVFFTCSGARGII